LIEVMDDQKTLLQRIAAFIKRKRFAVARRLLPSVKARYELERQVGPIGFWDQLSEYQFNFLKRMGVQPHHRLLDIGCGPLQGGLPMIEYLHPGNYSGVDLRQKAIETAYSRVLSAGLVTKNPQLVVSSSFGKDELGDRQYDYVWATQILCHLDESLIDRLLEQVAARLSDEGQFLADIIGTTNNVRADSHWNGFSFHLHTPEFVEATGARHGLEIRDLGRIEEFGYPEAIGLHTNRMFCFTRV